MRFKNRKTGLLLDEAGFLLRVGVFCVSQQIGCARERANTVRPYVSFMFGVDMSTINTHDT